MEGQTADTNCNLKQELERLRTEVASLTGQCKKQSRVLQNMRQQMKRAQAVDAAKDNISKVINEKRSRLEKYMSLLLGNCPDIILLFDRRSRIVYCTRSFLRRCALPTFGIIEGKDHAELLAGYVTPHFMDRWQKSFAHAVSNKRAIEFVESVDFQRNGTPRHYSVQITPMLGENNTVEGSMAFFYDTTEITKAQREAERASSAKSDFLATVSHEIRTPMNAIIGVASMRKGTGLDEAQLDYLNTIQSSSHVLLDLINDILDFSKIEAGKLELTPGYFSFVEMLKNMHHMFEYLFAQKKLGFSGQFDDGLPEVVYGDEGRIRQILANLLNNALKYTQQGQVTFRVFAQHDSNVVSFEVEDTGIGIHEESIHQLFTPFEQLHLVKHKNISGTGLGLAITKQLCEMMHGEISVQSRYGEGSRFTVLLPLTRGSAADLAVHEHQVENISFIAPKVRVLVVDDIEINLQVTAFMLEAFEITADLAGGGVAAIEKAAHTDYDLIFMDHIMPEMDGVEAALNIRRLGGRCADMPIVALTANAISEAKRMFVHSGFNDILTKPVSEAELAECLLAHLPKEKIKKTQT